MRNPWLDIPLGDYEAHMALPSVGQAMMLAAQFELLIARKSPASVAVIGCAGGNGLERIADGEPTKVVAVDLDPKYVADLRTAAEAAGFTWEASSIIQIASGRRFSLQIFRAAGGRTP